MRPKRVVSPASQPSPDSSASGRGASRSANGADAAEDQHVRGLRVLAVEVEARGPLLAGGALGVAARHRRARVRGRRQARERQRLAHRAVAEVDEDRELLERAGAAAGASSASGARRATVTSASRAPLRARPIVSASKAISGCAADSASSRTHAASRWRGPTRENATARSTPSPTFATVPLQAPVAGQRELDVDGLRLEVRAGGRARLRRDLLDGAPQAVDDGIGEVARRQPPARLLGLDGGVELGAGEHLLEQLLTDAPLLEVVELDRQRVVAARRSGRPRGSAGAARGTRAPGSRRSATRSSSSTTSPRCVGQRAAEERRRGRALGRQRAGAFERDAVEAPGVHRPIRPATKLRGSNGCSG